MSDEKRDEKPNPVDDLKQGLGLLFRAAKGAVEKIPTQKIESAVKEGAKEVAHAVENVADQIDKVIVKATTSGSQPPQANAEGKDTEASKDASTTAGGEEKKDEKPFDDAYAPEPPKGPRVG